MMKMHHETRRRRHSRAPTQTFSLRLNLPLKQTLNHKAKLTITLAYDQNQQKTHQHKKPDSREIFQIKYIPIRD
ncbi:hypothetical protein C3432_14780 [Citrobacter amalonaticus]|uniref:Uncharacterized protein n=1 Tax=Citrobacter amalonaticus TaxID=35703 RepID=A0A2S4RWJ1_CITAM|nr:hypothetical protein C3432_14780 [Citrobacter amalonaticus]POT75193.1 hypothetical protein C3436_15250 [Citrobacter amalonaticus]POU64722.1 hypothetical protein C3430_16270 [Citrobacter amalonaticus]POV04558.1 hypothetical protein C3424_15590 [Citrobacter amalonaticus]